MKFSLGSALLFMACIATALAWYVERRHHLAVEARWNVERIGLIQAAAMFGENNFRLNLIEDDSVNDVFPDHTTPSKSDKEIEQEMAGENLILLVNLEKDFRTVLQLKLGNADEVDELFLEFAGDFWRKAGRPKFNRVQTLAKNSANSITIERPKELKWLIETLEQLAR